MPLATRLASRRRQWAVILSPIGVIALGNGVDVLQVVPDTAANTNSMF